MSVSRIAERTRALIAAPGPTVDDVTRARVRARLVAALGPVVEPLPRGAEVVITGAMLRRSLADPGSLPTADEPFSWKPAFARRSMGLATVEACVSGRFRSPSEAVEPVVADAVAEWQRSGWRTYHWEPWVSALSAGARAMVLADAVTWATSLWTAFDWTGFGVTPRFGGGDDQWICPVGRTLRLKGRAELRVPVIGGEPVVPEALVTVAGGLPGDGWAEELAYVALVAGLRSASRPVPARVMGMWPEAGVARAVEIDGAALDRAADRVVRTVTAAVGARCGMETRVDAITPLAAAPGA